MVLDITGQLFEYLMPSNIERIAVESLDVTKRLPRLESELFQSLCKHGFREQDISLSCSLQEQFKLIQKLGHGNGKEPIFSNEYVWGPNHHKIAYAISNLELDKKQKIEEVIEAIQNKQGYPLDSLKNIDQDLLLLAKKTGIINPTTIVTNRGLQKDFGFSANLIQTSIYDDDILDDVKLLLASIRFAEHYTDHSTIYDPVKFLKALIDRPPCRKKFGTIGRMKTNIVEISPCSWGHEVDVSMVRKSPKDRRTPVAWCTTECRSRVGKHAG